MTVHVHLHFESVADAIRALAKIDAGDPAKLDKALDRAIDAALSPCAQEGPTPSDPCVCAQPVATAPQAEAPVKRQRRTKAQIAADEAAAKSVPALFGAAAGEVVKAAVVEVAKAAGVTPGEVVAEAIGKPAPSGFASPAAMGLGIASIMDAAQSVGEVSQDQVKSALIAFAQKHGKDAAFALLQKYGADKISALAPANRVAILLECQA